MGREKVYTIFNIITLVKVMWVTAIQSDVQIRKSTDVMLFLYS